MRMSMPVSRERMSLTLGDHKVTDHLAAWKLSTGERVLLDLLGRHPFAHSEVLGAIRGSGAPWVRQYPARLVRRGRAHPFLHPTMTPGGEAPVELSPAGLRRLCGYLGV